MFKELQNIKNHKIIKRNQTFDEFIEEADAEAFFASGDYAKT